MLRILRATLKVIAVLVVLGVLAGAVLELGFGASRFRASAELASSCAALELLKPEHVTSLRARAVSAGGETVWPLPMLGLPWLPVPASCRVTGVIEPVPGSRIGFETWLPAAESWNGKFQGTGNGGFAGSVEHMHLVLALQEGYATANTDTGHVAAIDDGRWVLESPERINDFGHRAVHEMTLASKALIAAFYGRPAQRAYFAGCSNGGRQALVEAQRYPEDYDGILAGAPAADPTGGLASGGYIYQALNAPGGYIDIDTRKKLRAAALEQCDALDGVKDGVIDNPRACKLDVTDLLHGAQLKTAQAFYEGAPDTYAGRRYRGFSPATEVDWISLAGEKQGEESGMGKFLVQYLRFLTHRDPAWQFSRFAFAEDRALLEQVLGPPMGATNPDLSAFAARGGKLIIYHGWNDTAIPPMLTVDYYESVRAKLGAAADASVRLYMAPGMQHCMAGDGPNVFGQLSHRAGPQRSASAALEQWVEQGVAPQAIVATKYETSGGAADAKRMFQEGDYPVRRTRPLCPYPQLAKYRGGGSTDDAANFGCMTPLD